MPGPAPDFAVSGKFGIRDGEQGYSARFNWRQHSEGYEIDVWGPLGQGRTRLRGDGQRMQVSRGTEVLALGAPEQVMLASLGWSVPIHVLPAWIRGEPQTELEFADAVYDEQGRYSQFAQAGWRVSLSRYRARAGALDEAAQAAPELTTPGRIVAEYGTRRVTVVVREYEH